MEIFSPSPHFVLTGSCFVNNYNSFVSVEACELRVFRASQVALVVKNLPANAGDVRDGCLIPGLGRSLGVEMATHYSILAWIICGQRSLAGHSSSVVKSWTQMK